MGYLYGLIGHPVGHSLSAVMINAAFARHGLGHVYHCFDVEPARLQEAVAGIRGLDIAGFNVTVPHKVAVMPYLDKVDEEAKRIGAVNTVRNDNGTLVGTNTDGRGYLLALKERAGDLKDKKLLMLGAGGAARGVAATLDREGARSIDIANRTPEKAESLIAAINLQTASRVLTLDEAEKSLEGYDIIINTTPVGMSPRTENMPLEINTLKEGSFLSDLIYNPLQTKWLREGQKHGALVMDGVDMFINQGALAFETWTGIMPDRTRMKETVLALLQGGQS